MKHYSNFLPSPFEKLTKIESKIYQFIENYQHETFMLSQKQLAQKVNASEATISRFIKKIGFQNYKNFMITINQSVNKNEFFSINKKDHESLANIISSHQFVFEKNINYELLKKCENLAHDLRVAKKVIVFGVGTSHYMSEELSSNMQRLDVFAITPRDLHTLLPLMGNPHHQEMYIVISNNLENKEIDFIINKVKDRSNLYVITSNKIKANTMGIPYEKVIGYHKLHNEDNKIAFSSKNAITLIIDLIFLLLLENSPRFLKNKFKNGMNVIEEWKMWNE